MRINYENSSALLCVIGDPIGHSLSPLLHNTMLQQLGENAIYLAVPVKAQELGDFVAAAKIIGIGGFNLTMPHKEHILPYLCQMTPEARRCNSVNSVRIVDGQLQGHSTDGIGFRRSLQDHGEDFPGRIVTILGAGGAAKSIAMTAVDSGAAKVIVANRTLEKAQALCQGEKHMEAVALSQVAQVLPQTDILVSTLPVGMAGVGGCGIPSLTGLKAGALCMDCIYAPQLTPFMEEARRTGHRACNGIGMLVYQAIYALEFFLDKSFGDAQISRLGKTLLEVSGVDPLGGAL